MKIIGVLLAVVAFSDAILLPKLPALAGLAGLAGMTVPAIVGGKLVMVPKILFLKGAIGLAGLKIAGAQHLKKKILIPAAITGAQAGYKSSSAVLAAPHFVAAGKAAAMQGMFSHLPQLPKLQVQQAPSPIQLPEIQHTFQVPIIPTPSIQWYQRPINLQLPQLVLQQSAPVHKTITIESHEEVPPMPTQTKPSGYAIPEPQLPEPEQPIYVPQQPM